MGINEGSKIFHKLKDIRLPQLAAILRDLRPSPSSPGPTQRRPCVAIDGNWICNRVGGIPGRLMNIAEAFVAQDINVIIVFDGAFRHHSKRVSTKRSADCEKARIKAIETRAALMKLRNGGISDEAEEKKLSRNLKTLETQSVGGSGNRFHPGFANAVVAAIEKKGTSSIQSRIALTQADTVLAKLIVDGHADAILGNDGDFPVLIGGKGIAISDFKYDVRKKQLRDFTLATGFVSVLRRATRSISMSDDKILHAQFPLIDGRDDPRFRCLVAVCLGNDTCVSGVPGVAASTLSAIIEASECDGDYDKLLKAVAERPRNKKYDASHLDVFVDAMMYEPADLSDHAGQHEYMFGKPKKKLCQYLEMFTDEGDELVDGPETLVCCGFSGDDDGKHSFLKAEGFETCSNDECKAILCRFCCMESADKKQRYCCGCYVEEVVDMSYNGPTYDDMKSELARNDKEYIASNMSYLELKEYYLKIVGEEKFSKLDNLVENKVEYPVLPTGALNDNDQLSTALSFDFCDGGRFLSDPTLDDGSVIAAVNILGALVDYSVEDPETASKKKTYEVHGVVPTLLRKFAEGARADDGIRVLKRAVRHAVDPKTPTLLNASGKVCKHEDTVALLISSAVHASMKDNNYHATVAFSEKDLLAASCECDSGPTEADDRHICVHVCSHLCHLVLLLFDCLAEHILCEIVCRYSKADPSFDSQDERERFFSSIKLLVQASGRMAPQITESTTIVSYLTELNVGTEKQKLAPRPPHPNDL